MIGAPERYDIDASDSNDWFTEESVKPVHLINEFLLTLLVAEPLRPGDDNRVQLALSLRESLVRLDPKVRQRVAHCPVALVDADFANEPRWAAAVAGTIEPSSPDPIRGSFPRASAVRLALMTLNVASTTSQLNSERACLVFGMSPGCARLLGSLSLPILESLAERHAEWVRPRWERRPGVWRTMIESSERPSAGAVPSIGLRAMQLQLGELALATPICAATRQIHR